MTTVFISGLGLIGSSLARAIKEAHPAVRIIARDTNEESLRYAVSHQIIDQAADSLTAADQADLIILASPVSQIVRDLEQLSQLQLKPGAIVTDVGSTKQTIMKAAQRLIDKGVTFIGGHPMAGSHKSGVRAGRADLIENAFYFLIPGQDDPAAVQRLTDLLSGTHAKWLTVQPHQHDKIVAQISHVPHVIAAELVNQTQQTFANEPIGMRVAAGGFKSVTRIAASDPTMWSAILLNNQELITHQLDEYIRGLQEVNQQIKAGDRDQLFDFFARAKTSRESLNHPAKKPFYDLFVNIPDHTGELGRVTTMLGAAEISIINLQILEVREDVNGILQLTFASQEDREQAASVLKPHYEIVTR